MSGQPQVTVVVPVMDEEENIRPLLERLLDAFTPAEIMGEVIFVDDSIGPETGYAIARAIKVLHDMPRGDTLHVRHVHRTGTDREDGLSGSVIVGLREAAAPFVIVMDGDLQHPPEDVPNLLDKLAAGYDAVLTTRYRQGGSSEGLNGPLRHVVSRVSTLLAKALFPMALRGASDPMTGFFGVRAEAINLQWMRPRGFKILLELLARHPHLQCTEIPLNFAAREAGESKGTLKQGVEYIRHLARLRISTLPRR